MPVKNTEPLIHNMTLGRAIILYAVSKHGGQVKNLGEWVHYLGLNTGKGKGKKHLSCISSPLLGLSTLLSISKLHTK